LTELKNSQQSKIPLLYSHKFREISSFRYLHPIRLLDIWTNMRVGRLAVVDKCDKDEQHDEGNKR